MILKQLKNKKNLFFLILVTLVYVILQIVCINNCYFWDNVQQISKEAHWFYINEFHSIPLPENSSVDLAGTGYHPPLMGIMTAVLWEIFGYHLWVSHVFTLLWGIILIFNVRKILRLLFPDFFYGWVLVIVLFESSLLTQFAIGSPDFILFTAFIISLRAVLERKPLLLTVGIFFLCCINMRGIFAGVILLIVNIYYSYLDKGSKPTTRSIFRTIIPYIPTLVILALYFTNYFIIHGWFFSGSATSGHYSIPTGLTRIIKHSAEFGLRSIENGRFVVWFIVIYIAYLTYKSKTILTRYEKVILVFFLLLTSLYVLFIFITQMPFSARYFMPQFFLLTILTLQGVIRFFNKRTIYSIFILILCMELTGHFWIYPDKIAKSWDCTLAHLPFYELRKECINYIASEKMNYKEISGGFCLYGNSRYIDLTKNDNTIGNELNRKYFIYSNISNVEDNFVKELHNRNMWVPIKNFEKGYVLITIYKNISININKKE